jgi:hypothetical protein
MRVRAEFEMLGLRRGDLSSEGIPSFVSLAFTGKLQSSSPTPLPVETARLEKLSRASPLEIWTSQQCP